MTILLNGQTLSYENILYEDTGAVITAVGGGARQDAPGALDMVGGLSHVKRVVLNFQRAGIKDLVLVCGEEEDAMKKQLRGFGVTFLKMDLEKGTEMFEAVKLGLRYCQERCSQIFVCPVDVPFFSSKTVERLWKSPAEVAIPSYKKRGGHPVKLRKQAVESILLYQGSDGLRGAIREAHAKIEYIEVEDEGSVSPAGERTADHRLEAQYRSELSRARVKVQLVNTKPYFGPGMVTLLKQIQSLGSVREASEKTGISYSKAWTMIRTAESETGVELVGRQQGGKHGGMAEVTKAGLELIRKYEELERCIQRYSDQKFREIFRYGDQ